MKCSPYIDGSTKLQVFANKAANYLDISAENERTIKISKQG